MVATLQHQPDTASGTVFAPEIGVYSGWVAHAGSFAARQCAAEWGPVRLLFSGECFGPSLHRGASLLEQYQAQGSAFVPSLNGLFSGLLINRMRGHALLFNDRYGSERLYWFEKDGVTYFSSEAKALLAVLPELRAFDDTGVAQFLAFGSTIGGHTLFRGLRLVPGGSLWRIAPGEALHRARYFTPADWEALPALSESQFERRFTESFRNLLSAYLRADQQVGLSMTGGLDTRMILACTPRGAEPVVAYTYAAEGGNRMLDLTTESDAGGIRSADDLAAIEAVGCEGAIVGRALLDETMPLSVLAATREGRAAVSTLSVQ
jgi:asparagine synthase (glutamine-hydrolysing)